MKERPRELHRICPDHLEIPNQEQRLSCDHLILREAQALCVYGTDSPLYIQLNAISTLYIICLPKSQTTELNESSGLTMIKWAFPFLVSQPWSQSLALFLLMTDLAPVKLEEERRENVK